MHMFRAFGLTLLCACGTKAAFDHWTVPKAALCVGTAQSISLLPGSASELQKSGGQIVAPRVQAIANGQTTDLTSHWDGAAVIVDLPASLSDGVYDLVLTRASDGAKTTLPKALKVLAAPQISSVSGQAVCTTSSALETFVINGQNVSSDTNVFLQGLEEEGPLATAFSATGAFTVSISPTGKTPGHVYPLIVSNGSACQTVYSDGYVYDSPVTVTQAIAGPHLHASSTALAGNAPITVRVTGTGFAARTQVSLGQVTAAMVTPTADGTSADATFTASTLANGPGQQVFVTNSVCPAVAAPGSLEVGSTDMTIDRVSPNGRNAFDSGSIIDVFGSFSAASPDPPVLWVDKDPSPFTEDWAHIPFFVTLDAAKNALRFAGPSGYGPGAQYADGNTNISVTSADGTSHEGFFSGFSYFNTQVVPRIVWKSKDWLDARGDSITVYGCNLGGASFKLVQQQNGSWSDVPGGELVSGGSSDQAWASAKFKCTNGNTSADQASDAVTLTAPAIAAGGPYRLRAFVGTSVAEIDSDDLYPIMIYDLSALTLGSFTVSPLTLNTARKGPGAVIAADAIGRKYFYVQGGATVSTTDPADGGNTTLRGSPTYEFSALDPDHGLVALAQGSGSISTVWSWGGGSSGAYGGAWISDGTLLYRAGGYYGASPPSALVWQMPVLDPTLPGAQKPFGQLGTYTVTSPTSLCAAFTSSCTTTVPLYGAGAVMVGAPASRTIEVFGGFGPSNTPITAPLFFELAVTPTGLAPIAAPTAAALSGASSQAPLALIADNGNLYAPLGSFSSDIQAEQVLSTGSASSLGITGLPNPATCGASSDQPCMETGAAALALGTHLFLLGGTDRSSSVSWDASSPRQSTLLFDVTAPAPVAATPLYRRLAMAGAALAAPYVYLASGIVCTADDPTPGTDDCSTPAGRALTPQIEQALLR